MSEHTPHDPGIDPTQLVETAVAVDDERLRAEISSPVGSVAIAAEMGQSDVQPDEVTESQIHPEIAHMKRVDKAFFGQPADLIKQIDEGEIDVNDTDFEDRTAVMIMTARGHTDTVKDLLARGADLNRFQMFQGRIPMSALDAARQTSRKDIEQLLLENGAKSGRELQAEKNAAEQTTNQQGIK